MAGSLDSEAGGSLDLARGMIRRSPGSGFDATGEQIKNVADPTDLQDAATKAFVVAFTAGLDMQESVLSYQNDPPVAPPTIGDRYLIGTPTVLNAWTGHDDEVAEWNGVGWDFGVPNPGWIVFAEDTAIWWVFTGGAWNDFWGSWTRSIDMVGGSGTWFRRPQMTQVQADTMVLTFGAADAGKSWFNTTVSQNEHWNGTLIVLG